MSSLQYYIDEFYSPAQPEMILKRLNRMLEHEHISMKGDDIYLTAPSPNEVSKSKDLTALAFKAIREDRLACYVQVDTSVQKYEKMEIQFKFCHKDEQIPFDREEVKRRIQGTGNKFFIKSQSGEYFGDDLKESYYFSVKEFKKQFCHTPVYFYNVEKDFVYKSVFTEVMTDTPNIVDDIPMVLVKFSCTYKKRWRR